jgi:processive 1,2-diacylglycerol beta-glucosyltransferase
VSPTKAEGVLLLSAMYGEGHRRAAQAVGLALDELQPALPHWEEDYFEFVDHRLNKLVARTYVLSVRHLPLIWHAFYRGTSRVAPDSAMQRFLNGLGRKRLRHHLEQAMPRVVVNTFPTPAGVLSTLRGKGELSLPNLVVITDYTVHSQWLHPHVDRYYVGSDSVREGMIQRGIPPERILATGIPIHPRFRDLPSRNEARAMLGLDERPTVLAMAGAYGMIGGFPQIVAELLSEDLPCQLLVVAGRDPQLRAALEALPSDGPTGLRVFGFVEDIEKLYAAADVVFGKSGGLTVTETLQSGLPMLIYRPIPGQEQVNAAFVSDAGAGIWVREPQDLLPAYRRLVQDAELRNQLSFAARRLARPDAAQAIAKDVAYWHAR